MRMVTLALVLVASASGLASAQRLEADSTRMQRLGMLTKQLGDLLFRGIPLSASRDSAARVIVGDAVMRRDLLNATEPSFHEQAVMLVQRRDSLLRQLLATDAERKQFSVNASSRMLVLDGEVRISPPPSDD